MLPEKERTGLSMEKSPIKMEEIEKGLPLHQWCTSSSSKAANQPSVASNACPALPSLFVPLLNVPGPFGLKLTKSPSFLELIQRRLSQNYDASGSENLELGNKKWVMAEVGTSSSINKLKASIFPAGSLRIGKWEYVPQRVGDLVAKFYFVKHKLVWEFLCGESKNRIQIDWEDIVGLKANCPENGPCSLTVVLGKQPLFFVETNSQPRKHNIWQETSDFTSGNASTYRQHHLQCAQDVLNKHYEKLIHFNPRLNFLSRQPETVLDLLFTAEASIKPPNVLDNSVMPSTSQSSFVSTEELGTVGLVSRDLTKDTRLPNSEVSRGNAGGWGSNQEH